MEVTFTLALPRDEVSVPVARRMLGQYLDLLGAEREVVADVQLALTEACTNVLDHADAGDDYEVRVAVRRDRCVIEVVDRGHGFDGTDEGRQSAAPDAEGGRGIQLIRALVDRVEFVDEQHQGTVLHLEKQLRWREDAVAAQLTWQDEPRR